MSYIKFTVQKLSTTRSGDYAHYVADSGMETLTGNFGFIVGDVVEMWDYDGCAPLRIDVNGVTKWNEENRRKWWLNYDPKSQYYTNPYRKN